ncbi:MAG TPA: hypothetical protein VLD17_01185 [Gemmatimonadaceae bacterium]|nr:hypothetical protein [Gemmatimonadaceae bacterium]
MRYCERDCAYAVRERFDRWLRADGRHRAFYDVIALGGSDMRPYLEPPDAPDWGRSGGVGRG